MAKTLKCNEPYYAQDDGSTIVSALGVGFDSTTAFNAAGAAAVAMAIAKGKEWFDGKDCANAKKTSDCPNGCLDKQGGYSHTRDPFAFNMKTVIALPFFGLKLYIAEASANWGGVVICRCPHVEA